MGLAGVLPLWLTRVESGSMTPTLRPGQLALTTRLRPAAPVRRGDVVVLDVPEAGRRMLKRIIGLPGERVDIHNGRVSIDGVPLDEPYASASVFNGSYDVPAGHYFVMGDARDLSSDSRVWRQPFIARHHLRGRVHGRRGPFGGGGPA